MLDKRCGVSHNRPQRRTCFVAFVLSLFSRLGTSLSGTSYYIASLPLIRSLGLCQGMFRLRGGNRFSCRAAENGRCRSEKCLIIGDVPLTSVIHPGSP